MMAGSYWRNLRESNGDGVFAAIFILDSRYFRRRGRGDDTNLPQSSNKANEVVGRPKLGFLRID
jgi:hypothetical protein